MLSLINLQYGFDFFKYSNEISSLDIKNFSNIRENTTANAICDLNQQPWLDTLSQVKDNVYKTSIYPAICVTASISAGSLVAYTAASIYDRNVDSSGWKLDIALKFLLATVFVYSSRDLVKNSAEIYLGKGNSYSMIIDIGFSTLSHAARVPLHQSETDIVKIGLGALDGFLYSSMAYFTNNKPYGKLIQIFGAQTIEIIENLVGKIFSNANEANILQDLQIFGGSAIATLCIDLSLAEKNNYWYEYQQVMKSSLNETLQFIEEFQSLTYNILQINNKTADVVSKEPDDTNGVKVNSGENNVNNLAENNMVCHHIDNANSGYFFSEEQPTCSPEYH